MHTHQEDQVGLLVKGSGDADPLFLPTRQDDPLSETAMNALGATSLRRRPLTRSQHAAHERPRSSSPRAVVKEIRLYFLLCWCMRRCDMTVVGLNKVLLGSLRTKPHILTAQWWICTEHWGSVRLGHRSGGTSRFCCGTDPLADLRLVALREDVDVRLEGTGVDYGFVSGGGQKGETYGWGRRTAADVGQGGALQAGCLQHFKGIIQKSGIFLSGLLGGPIF